MNFDQIFTLIRFVGESLPFCTFRRGGGGGVFFLISVSVISHISAIEPKNNASVFLIQNQK